MKKEIHLSRNYILRKSLSDEYILYNKATDIKYTISEKLHVFLSLFKKNSYELGPLLNHFRDSNIDTTDIETFLSRGEFKDIFYNTSINEKNKSYIDYYSITEKLSPFTEYSPIKIDFLITKHCNLACKHCFENSSPIVPSSFIKIEEALELFKQIDIMNVQTVKITGGEPFSYLHMKELIRIIAEFRFECIILTNAMLIDEESMQIMADNHIKLGISLDGIDSETHDFIRGRGSFDILQKQLLLLKKHGVKFSITTSLNRKNHKEIPSIANYVLNFLGARMLFINQLKPFGRAKFNKHLFISKKDYDRVINEVHKLEGLYGNKISLSDDNIEIESLRTTEENPSIICAAGNTTMSIDDSLNVFPCIYGNDLPDYCIGNLKQKSLIDIWESPKWDRFRGLTKLNDIKGCSTCKYNNTCGLKNCRLKPVYEGRDFFSHVSYCKNKSKHEY